MNVRYSESWDQVMDVEERCLMGEMFDITVVRYDGCSV